MQIKSKKKKKKKKKKLNNKHTTSLKYFVVAKYNKLEIQILP
jgi:hypothetical protein